MTAAVKRRVVQYTEAVEKREHADAAASIAVAVARANRLEAERDAAVERAERAEQRARTVESDVANAQRRATRKLEEELAALRRENFKLRVENEQLVAAVAAVRREAAEHCARHGTIWVPRRERGKGVGRGRRHSNQLRKIYMKVRLVCSLLGSV